MRSLGFTLAIGLLASILLAESPAPRPSETASTAEGVLARMVAARDGLNTFSVPIHFDVTVHELVDVHLPLDGTRYFQRPDKEALILNTVPAVAKAFQRLYANFGTAETWPDQYTITLVQSTAANSATDELKLVPKKEGNVAYVLMDVSRSASVPVETRWFYRNGATVFVQTQNAKVKNRYVLPSTETLDVNFPSYKAHAIAHYGDYTINQPIPDSVWQSNVQS